MNVNRLFPILVVFLGVLAISAAAASMDATPSTTQIGAGDGDQAGAGDADQRGYTSEAEAVYDEDRREPPSLPNFFRVLMPALFGAGVLAYLGYAAREVWRDGVDGLRKVAIHAVTTIVPVGVAWAFLWGSQLNYFMKTSGFEASESSNPNWKEGGGKETAIDTAVETATSGVVPLVLLALGTVFVVGLAYVLLSRGTDGDTDAGGVADGGGDDSVPVTDDGATITRQSIEDVAASNRVYEAWRELADDVAARDQRTRTPGEIATRATEQGKDRAAVQTLTDLFAEVRYGRRPATSDRESRAESALDSLRSGGDES